MPENASSTYSARHLQVLDGLEHVRTRPGMYIGTTDSRGLMHCLWEIIDNSVDEGLAGFASHITIELFSDSSVCVSDDGRGVPVDIVPGVGLSGVEVVYTKLHAGGKFGGGLYDFSGGLHGVGASVVNALSSRMDVQVMRGGKIYQMQFRRGEPGRFDDSASVSPDSPFTPFVEKSELDVIGKCAKKKTGTRVRYWADRQIFHPQAEFSLDKLIERARQTAFLVPGLHIEIVDKRGEEESTHSFEFAGGTRDFAEFLAPDAPITSVMQLTGEATYKENAQVFDQESGNLRTQEVERQAQVDISLRWGNGYDTVIESFVNIIRTPGGGTHQSGAENAIVKVARQLVEANARRLKVGAKDVKLEKDDVLAGLTAVVTVRIPEPQFEGQTKEVLGTPAVRSIVSKIVEEKLTAILTSKGRDQKTETTRLLEKFVAEMRARVAARMHKEISRRKNALESSSFPAKLADCRTHDIATSELFIVEGDSALGTARLARSSEFQALLPIRGKILNVQKASHADILHNAEVSAIIQVIGAGSGRTCDISQARYGKIIMMTDADVDGAHIRTLLLTLFFRYLRPLVEDGRVYAAVPPLHRIEVAGAKKAEDKYIYTYSEEQLHEEIKKLHRQGKNYKDPIQRYKGLGEMDAHQLAETTMDPAKRTLRRITMEDEQAIREAQEVFELLMGSDVPPRREFIVEGAKQISRESIDA